MGREVLTTSFQVRVDITYQQAATQLDYAATNKVLLNSYQRLVNTGALESMNFNSMLSIEQRLELPAICSCTDWGSGLATADSLKSASLTGVVSPITSGLSLLGCLREPTGGAQW